MTSPGGIRVLARPPRPSAGRTLLLCLPYAGGGVRSYESWQRLLPDRVTTMTLRLPGREVRADEPPPTDLCALAGQIAEELGPHLAGPSFAVFGHSMGGLIAFELCRALRDSFGIEPSCLLVSGMSPPETQAVAEKYSRLGDGDLRSALESMGGTAPEVLADPELWEVFRPIIRSDMTLCDTYVYRPGRPLGCPIVAYGSRGDPGVNEERLGSWRRHTTGAFASRLFPGDHFYFTSWPEAFAMDLVNRLYQFAFDEG